mgnify:CR=1 FL=1
MGINQKISGILLGNDKNFRTLLGIYHNVFSYQQLPKYSCVKQNSLPGDVLVALKYLQKVCVMFSFLLDGVEKPSERLIIIVVVMPKGCSSEGSTPRGEDIWINA